MASKYKARNEAQIQENSRGYLQYQIPAVYSLPIYGKKQKYISFGAKTSIEALTEAREKLKLLNQDLENGTYDSSNLVKYKHSQKQIKSLYNNKKTKTTLLELFEDFTNYRFANDKLGTGRFRYDTRHRPVLVKCKQQNINTSQQQRQIAEFINQAVCYGTATEMYSLLNRIIERAKAVGDLSENNPNIFLDYLKEYKNINKEEKRKYPSILTSKGYIRNPDKQAWTIDEMKIIIQAFRDRKKYSVYYAKCDIKTLLIEFLFYTGVRHGEAFGLKWKSVSKDFSKVLIHESYSSNIRVQKGTKTGKTRHINLNTEAQNVLIKLKDFYQEIKPNAYVFAKENGKPLTTQNFFPIWQGASKNKSVKERPGIVTQLVLDGKLDNYIEMYSTRRTFTSLMAQKHDARTVADYIGDNVETILRHYYFGKENFTPDNFF